MNSQRLFLFQHFYIVVVKQFVGIYDTLMMADGIEQQSIPWVSGVQFPVSGLLQKNLYFFFIKF